jgi:hypothetical protein
MRFAVLVLVLALASCSSVQTTKSASAPSLSAFASSEPFSVAVSAPTPQLERLIQEYVATEFGRTLKITEGSGGQGTIEVTYASSGQSNTFADWRNSTMLVVIRTPGKERLWSGEYDYKGGMEFSGFTVTTAEEAAKLVVQRIAKKFEADVRH